MNKAVIALHIEGMTGKVEVNHDSVPVDRIDVHIDHLIDRFVVTANPALTGQNSPERQELSGELLDQADNYSKLRAELCGTILKSLASFLDRCNNPDT